MTWQLAIAISIVGNVITTLVMRRYSQKSKLPPSWPAFMSYLLGVYPVGVLIGLSLPHSIHWTSWLVVLLIIESVAICLYNWIAFRAVKLLPVASYQTIYQTYAIFVIILGWSFLGEGLTPFQVIGTAILLVAAILAIYAPARKTKGVKAMLKHRHAVLLTLLAAIFLAIGLVAEKAALGYMSAGTYLIVGWGTQVLALFVLALFHAKEALPKIRPSEVGWSALYGATNGIAGALYVISIYLSNNISIVTAIAALSLPLLAIAAHFVLHERDNPRLLWGGIGLAFVGLLVLAL